jgi:hypothetical protein
MNFSLIIKEKMRFKQIVGVILVLLALIGLTLIRELKLKGTGYFVGVSVSGTSLLIGMGLLVPPIVHFIRTVRSEEMKKKKWGEIAEKVHAMIKSYIKRWEKDIGTKNAYKSSFYLISKATREAYRLTGNIGYAVEVVRYLIDLLGGSYPEAREDLIKAFGKYERGIRERKRIV